MPAWKAMQQSLREWMYRAERAEAERNEWKRRAEAAEAKLALVDEYGQSQWHSGASGSEFEAGPCETFAEWLSARE